MRRWPELPFPTLAEESTERERSREFERGREIEKRDAAERERESFGVLGFFTSFVYLCA